MRLIEERSDVIIVHGVYGRPLTHLGRGLVDWPVPNESIEFHFTSAPYSVSASWNADGSFWQYYGNVNTPATLSEGVLSLVDLDLDLLVTEDLAWRVEDEDEFEAHRREWGYPEEVVELARSALAELIQMVEERWFPFDGSAFRLREQLSRSGAPRAESARRT